MTRQAVITDQVTARINQMEKKKNRNVTMQ